MVSDELDALRGQFSACKTIAFADLSTGMILMTNGDASVERNSLDRLCTEAALLLSKIGQPQFGDLDANTAIAGMQNQIRVFLRAPSEPNDALCCIGTHELDLAAFLPQARACLQRISENG
ncbi:MAG: hypothetical protein WBC93_08550 [Sulfitobacter sp.]